MLPYSNQWKFNINLFQHFRYCCTLSRVRQSLGGIWVCRSLKQACKEGLGNGTPDNYLKDHRLHGFIETEH